MALEREPNWGSPVKGFNQRTECTDFESFSISFLSRFFAPKSHPSLMITATVRLVRKRFPYCSLSWRREYPILVPPDHSGTWLSMSFSTLSRVDRLMMRLIRLREVEKTNTSAFA